VSRRRSPARCTTPRKKNPLYNATVYIPLDATTALPIIASGASCDTCAGGSPVAVVAVAQTGPDGKFTLNNAPSGANIPLIVQMGQWRRKVTLRSVTACTDNVVDKQYTHLPRNRFDRRRERRGHPAHGHRHRQRRPFECNARQGGHRSGGDRQAGHRGAYRILRDERQRPHAGAVLRRAGP